MEKFYKKASEDAFLGAQIMSLYNSDKNDMSVIVTMVPVFDESFVMVWKNWVFCTIQYLFGLIF